MKYFIVMAAMSVLHTGCFAQTESLDYATYTIPGSWTKEIKENAVVFSTTNGSNKTWCQIAVYRATSSRGNVNLDFESEWSSLVLPLGVADSPRVSGTEQLNGWTIKNGTGNFSFNGSVALSSLTTFSGYNTCFSVLANTNSADYTQAIQDFLASLQLSKPVETGATETDGTGALTSTAEPAVKDSYAFNTTHFEDGWTSTVQDNWVEVTKGEVSVLLHYAREGTVFPADPAPLINAAWNILVAPRYSDLKNYKTTYINTYNMVYMGMGYATENSTQQSKFIVLFRRAAGWMEVVAPDKNTFIRYFQFDPALMRWDSNADMVNTLEKMMTRNRFAVSAADLYGTGKWSNQFASNTFWSNYYSGAYEGMSTYTSSQWFVFGNGQSYTWELVAVNSSGGIGKFAGAKGAGTFKSLNNWQLYFSDIEGKPKTFDVYYTAIKGGRVLFMNDAQYPGSGIFTGYAKK